MASRRSSPNAAWVMRSPGMRGLLRPRFPGMRDELTAALQARWEDSLRQRAMIDPHSPVPLLDGLLAPLRGDQTTPAGRRARR
jgi:hypothetical protein